MLIGTVLSFLAFIIALYIASRYLEKIKNIPLKVVIIFVAALIPRLIICFTIRSEPWSDFHYYFEIAKNMAGGDILAGRDFCPIFPELQGFMFWQGLLVRVFGPGLITAKVLNSIFTSCTCIIIYFITRRMNCKNSMLPALLYAFYPSNILFSSVLTCQNIATPLFYLAFLILLTKSNSTKKKILIYIFTGLILGLANIMRPIGLPILAGVVIFVFIDNFIKHKDNTGLKRLINSAVCLIVCACYFVVTLSFSLFLYKSNITNEPFVSGDMRYKIVIGTHFPSSGSYEQELANTYINGDEAVRKELYDEHVRSVINAPLRTLSLIVAKIGQTWLFFDIAPFFLFENDIVRLEGAQSSGQLNNEESNTLVTLKNMTKIFNILDPIYCTIIYCFAIWYIWSIRKKRPSAGVTLLLLVLLLFAAANVLVEVQPRYRYFAMPALFIFASIGMHNAGIRITQDFHALMTQIRLKKD